MKRICFAVLLAATLPILAMAQIVDGRGGGRGNQPPKSPKAGAPVDFTGTWVSPVTEDWRWRMVTPLKGDSASVPVNEASRKIIEAWDPAKDEAAGQQCKAYGAPALLRIPGRLKISWVDDNTLKIESDEGSQTRLLHFNATPPAKAEPSWQGFSVANWERPILAPEGSGLGVVRVGNNGRSLEVRTTQLRPGYLRKNGVPYGAATQLTEYFDRHDGPGDMKWFTVTTVVDDPEYLTVPFVTSTDYRKEPDESKWAPAPCTAR
jgi:hypothetical protein